jgi:hypothetical protein
MVVQVGQDLGRKPYYTIRSATQETNVRISATKH